MPRARRRPAGRERGSGDSRGGARPVWLFDLDNTLHHASHAIFPLINTAMTAYIERALAIDTDAANLYRTLYTRRYGATLLGLIRHHAIDPHAFLRDVHTFDDDLATLVRTERGLPRLLRRLPGRKLILTNGPSAYAHAVLKQLRIGHLFERVIAVEQMRTGARWRAKPDAAMLRQALRRAGIRPADAILVDDTLGHLKRYHRLGIGTAWMTGHLPARRTRHATTGTPRLGCTGRPAYVGQSVRSLRALSARGRGAPNALRT